MLPLTFARASFWKGQTVKLFWMRARFDESICAVGLHSIYCRRSHLTLPFQSSRMAVTVKVLTTLNHLILLKLLKKDYRQSTMVFRYFRLAKLFQLLRLLRISRIWRYMHQMDEMFNLPYDSALMLFRMFASLCGLLMYAHLSACIQFMVPMLTNYPDDCWVRMRGLHHEDTKLHEQYG